MSFVLVSCLVDGACCGRLANWSISLYTEQRPPHGPCKIDRSLTLPHTQMIRTHTCALHIDHQTCGCMIFQFRCVSTVEVKCAQSIQEQICIGLQKCIFTRTAREIVHRLYGREACTGEQLSYFSNSTLMAQDPTKAKLTGQWGQVLVDSPSCAASLSEVEAWSHVRATI